MYWMDTDRCYNCSRPIVPFWVLEATLEFHLLGKWRICTLRTVDVSCHPLQPGTLWDWGRWSQSGFFQLTERREEKKQIKHMHAVFVIWKKLWQTCRPHEMFQMIKQDRVYDRYREVLMPWGLKSTLWFFYTERNKPSFSSCAWGNPFRVAGNWTWDLRHIKCECYHWDTAPQQPVR